MGESTSNEGSATTDGNALPNRNLTRCRPGFFRGKNNYGTTLPPLGAVRQ